VWGCLLGFSGCLFALYTATPWLLRRSSAATMNLSFLAADFWSLLAAVALLGARLHPLYLAAFAAVVAGLAAYHTQPEAEAAPAPAYSALGDAAAEAAPLARADADADADADAGAREVGV
jgi:solute carrier family 35 protein F1/2